ncbi:MAG: M20 family metallo-hydrolase [Candidatus Thermoplasmatota archaeon]|nr:M20 family metallo-hydrolase [Candidatus Thermoplasmatota archaeon]
MEYEKEKNFIVDMANRIIPVQAIGPSSGGKGEKERADVICSILQEMGFKDFHRFDFKDNSDSVRSNIVLKIGNKKKTFWVIPHIDTVPAGDMKEWKHPPFRVTREGDNIYGRGTGDNGQAIFMSLLLLKRLNVEKLRFNLGIIFVADEETGSVYGMQKLMDKGLFHKDDLVLVPDDGNNKGDEIEIAEKSILWLKFVVKGIAGHASTPSEARNSSRLGMKFMLSIDDYLHKQYNATDSTFSPEFSTFEPTKHELNVNNINTIPGEDVFYMDCRILPKYDLDTVLDHIHDEIRDFERENGITVNLEVVQKEQAPLPTPVTSEIYRLLYESLKTVRNIEAHPVGIGGGTVAKFFRERAIDAVVWITAKSEVYHRPNEYVPLQYIIDDTLTLEHILYS